MRTDKDEAFKLRKQGKSYKEISTELGMSKSTLTAWFKDVDFSEAMRSHLNQKAKRTNTARLKVLNKARGEYLSALYEQARCEAQQELEESKNDALFISAVVSYWGEGDKLSRNYVRITNTDPQMLQIFYSFLVTICKVPKEKINGALFIYKDLDEKECKDFWSEKIGIQRFHKTMILPSRHKERRLPHGICTLVVSNTYLKQKMLLWIDQLPKMVLNRGSK